MTDPAPTGWPPSELLQDDCRGLSRALSNTPHARLHAREAAEAIAATAERARLVKAAQAKARRLTDLGRARDAERWRAFATWLRGQVP